VFHRSHDDQPAPPQQQQTQQPQPQPLDFNRTTDRDIRALYARLRPDQRTAIGGEFIRLFRLSGDPAAQQFVKPVEGMLSAQQVAEMHIFARDHLPQVLPQVREHPVTQEALAHPGEEVEPVETEETIIQAPIEAEDQDVYAKSAMVGGSGAYLTEAGSHLISDEVQTPEGEVTGGGADVLESAEREGPLANPADHGG
jgi:hypothetical protein